MVVRIVTVAPTSRMKTPKEARKKLHPRDRQITGSHTSGRSRTVQWRKWLKIRRPSSSTTRLNSAFTRALKNPTTGSISRGKTTFLTKLTLFRIAVGALLTDSENILKVISPMNRARAKATFPSSG